MTEGATPTEDVTVAPEEQPAEGVDETSDQDAVEDAAPDESQDESQEADEEDGRDEGPDEMSDLEQEGDIAADYLEVLLDIADLDGDLDLDVEADRASVSIVGEGLQDLVGRNGEVLEALQELTRLAVLRETGERCRLMLDISGYRAGKRSALEKRAAEVAAEVRGSGESQKLEPMSPFERKVVHDAVAAAGLRSESEGEEPRRCVVVLPA